MTEFMFHNWPHMGRVHEFRVIKWVVNLVRFANKLRRLKGWLTSLWKIFFVSKCDVRRVLLVPKFKTHWFKPSVELSPFDLDLHPKHWRLFQFQHLRWESQICRNIPRIVERHSSRHWRQSPHLCNQIKADWWSELEMALSKKIALHDVMTGYALYRVFVQRRGMFNIE